MEINPRESVSYKSVHIRVLPPKMSVSLIRLGHLMHIITLFIAEPSPL